METIKVNIPDTEWEKVEPHFTINYHGKAYRALDIPVTVDGVKRIVTVAEYDLEEELFKGVDEVNVPTSVRMIDEHIAFYADPNKSVYAILDNVFGTLPHYAAA